MCIRAGMCIRINMALLDRAESKWLVKKKDSVIKECDCICNGPPFYLFQGPQQ